MSEVKIWKMNDCDWVAAETLGQAKQCLADTVGSGTVNKEFEDEFLDEPEALSPFEMKTLKFRDEDAPKEKEISFKERLQFMIASGEKFPTFFASTEF